jgi:hypothetical protein
MRIGVGELIISFLHETAQGIAEDRKRTDALLRSATRVKAQ